MSTVHLHIPSFNAGELSPLLGARFAVEKVASGCRLLRNFIPHVHGPVFRRPGTEDMGAAAGDTAKSSLRSFQFSSTTAFILELHPSGLRVWSNGQLVPLENDIPLPYTEAECAEVQMCQVNDVCYFAHANHPPMKLVRYTDTRWQFEPIPWKWPALGDENVRNDEIAAPSVTTLLTVPTMDWPEFRGDAHVEITLSVANPDLSSVRKYARLGRFYNGEWATVAELTWTTVAPGTDTFTPDADRTFRVTYEGPVSAGCEVSAGAVTLDCGVIQPASTESVTVPAGDWQCVVSSPATIPANAVLYVQRKSGGSWVNVKRLSLKASDTTTYRGVKLTADAEMRFQWSGRAMVGGTAKLESVGFAVAKELTLEIDVVNGNGRTLTASAPIFTAQHVGSYWQVTHRRAESFTQIVAAQPNIAAATSAAIRVSGKWDLFTYGIWNATIHVEKKINGVWESIRSWSARKDRNVIASGDEPEPVELRLRVTAGTSEASSAASVPRFVLECVESRVDGLVKVTAIGALTNGKSTTATVDVVSDLYSTTATPIWTEGAWSEAKGFPRCVAIHGARLWFSGTRTEPARIWGSVVNDFENFRRSSFDDASVSFTPAAQQANAVQWIASHGDELVMGTNGDEWTIAGGTDRASITPTSVNIQRRSSYGSMYRQPLILGDVLVFLQRGGRKLRQVAPRSDLSVWAANDLTVLAEHVTKSGIQQIAAMTFPQTILWCATNDGRLLGMTFEQEQNVFAWHVHETAGKVESVAVIYGQQSDEVWLAVQRDGKRRIERMDTAVFARDFSEPAKLVYLDSAKRLEFAEPQSVIGGLEHLNGVAVNVVGDGAELSPATVINGSLTLEKPCSTVIVGRPFTSLLQPMRVDIPMRDGTAQFRQFRVSRVGLFLHESIGGQIADSPTGRFSALQYRRVATPMDAAIPLFSGEMEMPIESSAKGGFDVTIRTSSPFPLNVGSLTMKGDVFGE